MGALQPAASANAPPSATRMQVVLLPHAPTEPTDTRPTNRHAATVTGMNQEGSAPHHPAQPDAVTRAITASRQWHDAELAMTVARHSFDRWFVAGHAHTPSLAAMHAHHTRAAVQEAGRAITMLSETFAAETTALITTSAQRDIPTQRR